MLGSCLGLPLAASVSLPQLCFSSISETEMPHKGADQKNITTSHARMHINALQLSLTWNRTNNEQSDLLLFFNLLIFHCALPLLVGISMPKKKVNH